MSGKMGDDRGDSEQPLTIEIGELSLDASHFSTPWGSSGWRARREAIIQVQGEPRAVEVDVCVVTAGTGDPEAVTWSTDHAEILETLTSAKVARADFNKNGSSITFRLDLAGRRRAVFKPEQINPQTVPRKEVAAYELNRLLGVDAVPPATLRELHRDDLIGRLAPCARVLIPRIEAETVFDARGNTVGCISHWVPTVVDSGLDTWNSIQAWSQWLGVDGLIPGKQQPLMMQLSSLLLFDLLVNNEDRFTGGNLLVSPDDRKLYWMDNCFSFAATADGHPRCRAFFGRCQKFSKTMVHALRDLDRAATDRICADRRPLLTGEEIDALFLRREFALRYIDDLARDHGESRILVFP